MFCSLSNVYCKQILTREGFIVHRLINKLKLKTKKLNFSTNNNTNTKIVNKKKIISTYHKISIRWYYSQASQCLAGTSQQRCSSGKSFHSRNDSIDIDVCAFQFGFDETCLCLAGGPFTCFSIIYHKLCDTNMFTRGPSELRFSTENRETFSKLI